MQREMLQTCLPMINIKLSDVLDDMLNVMINDRTTCQGTQQSVSESVALGQQVMLINETKMAAPKRVPQLDPSSHTEGRSAASNVTNCWQRSFAAALFDCPAGHLTDASIDCRIDCRQCASVPSITAVPPIVLTVVLTLAPIAATPVRD